MRYFIGMFVLFCCTSLSIAQDEIAPFEAIVINRNNKELTHFNESGEVIESFQLLYEGEPDDVEYLSENDIAISPDSNLVAYYALGTIVRVYDRRTQTTIFEYDAISWVESLLLTNDQLAFTSATRGTNSDWEIVYADLTTGDMQRYTGVGRFIAGQPIARLDDLDDDEDDGPLQWRPLVKHINEKGVYVQFTTSSSVFAEQYYIPSFIWNLDTDELESYPYLHSTLYDYLPSTDEFILSLADDRLPFYFGFSGGNPQVNSFHLYQPDRDQLRPVYILPSDLKRVYVNPIFIQGGERVLFYTYEGYRVIERNGTFVTDWVRDLSVSRIHTYGVPDGFVSLRETDYGDDEAPEYLLFWNTRTGDTDEPTEIYRTGDGRHHLLWVSYEHPAPDAEWTMVAPPLPNDDTTPIELGVGNAAYVNLPEGGALTMYEEPSLDAPVVESRIVAENNRRVLINFEPIPEGDKTWWHIGIGRGTFGWVLVDDDQLRAPRLNSSAPYASLSYVYSQDVPPVIEIGDRVVVVTDALNVRVEPGFSGEIVSVLLNNTQMVVTDGPIGQDGIIWWYVVFDDATEGWVALERFGEVFIAPLDMVEAS